MKRICLLLIVVVSFSSCTKKVGFEKHIPEETTVLFAIDVKSMMKKVVWEVLFSPEKLKKIFKKNQDASKVFQDPKSTGIDLFSRMYLFQTSTTRENELLGLIKLNEFDAFDKLLKEQKATHEKLEAFDYYQIEHTHFLTNREVVVFIVSPKKDVKEVLKEILVKENDVYGMKGMEEVLLSEHDFILWSNFYEFMEPKLGRLSKDESSYAALKEDVLTGYADFVNGAFEVVVAYASNGESQELKERFFAKDAFVDMIQNTSAKNVNGLFSFAVNLPEVTAFLKEKKVLENFNSGILKLYNTDPEQILNMLNGEVMVYYTGAEDRVQVKQDLIYDFEKEESKFVYDTINVVHYNTVLALGVKDPVKINELISKLTMMLEKKDLGYYKLKSEPYFLALHKGNLLVSNDEKSIILSLNGESLPIPTHVKSMIGNSPLSLWVDMDKSSRNLLPLNVFPEHETNIVKKYMNEILLYGERKGNLFEQHLEIKFKNDAKNSLIQLIDMFGELEDKQNKDAA